MEEIRRNYAKIDEYCNSTPSGFPHMPIDKSILDVPEQEREETLERLYRGPGFSFWGANYRDAFTDKRANDIVTAFAARKIRERVKDPKVADLLIPKDHGFGTRRVPLETRYYEAYNQDNVTLIDVRTTPIERVTPTGIKTTDRHYDLDVIIYASGFDAIRGALMRVELVGRAGTTLAQAWSGGIHSYLGLQVCGFPNLFTLVGPQNGTAYGNIPRNSALATDWLVELLDDCRKQGLTSIEATPEAEKEYTETCHMIANMGLFSGVDSWFTGINTNIPGRQRRDVLLWGGGAPAYRALCADIKAAGWRGFKRA
jgi:hypothetical protein